jgi:hypothetical protein
METIRVHLLPRVISKITLDHSSLHTGLLKDLDFNNLLIAKPQFKELTSRAFLLRIGFRAHLVSKAVHPNLFIQDMEDISREVRLHNLLITGEGLIHLEAVMVAISSLQFLIIGGRSILYDLDTKK